MKEKEERIIALAPHEPGSVVRKVQLESGRWVLGVCHAPCCDDADEMTRMLAPALVSINSVLGVSPPEESLPVGKWLRPQ